MPFKRSFLLLLFSFALFPLQRMADAELFRAELDQSEWLFSGSPFLCELSHVVPRFGKVHFLAEAGEPLRLAVESAWMNDFTGSLTLTALPPPWDKTRKPVPIGSILLRKENRPVEKNVLQLMERMQEGYWAEVNLQRPEHAPWVIQLTGVGFGTTYRLFNQCRTALLPANFDQLRQSTLNYASGKTQLTEQQRDELESIVRYVLADPKVARIEIDGHTDRTGRPLTNRDVSERRANRVRDYFLERGVSKKRLAVRYHGSRYPLNSGKTNDMKAKNRRVDIRLVRLQNSRQP